MPRPLCPSHGEPAVHDLQQFFKWAVDEGEIADNPMKRMKPPTVPEKAVPVLGGDEMKKLLADCDSKTFEGRRDEPIIRLFLDAGARLGEMVGMELADVDLDGHVVQVAGKGRRPRLLGFADRNRPSHRPIHPQAE